MTKEQINWGIVGLGKMAEVFASDFAHTSGSRVAAVASRQQSRADEFAAAYGTANAYGNYRELIADPDVDVVYVATPHPQHLAIALAAVEAGKPVLVEKAFTATLAGAHELVAAAREHGVFCMEAMWTRFQPAVVTARQLIADGVIGEVRMVQADLGAFREFDPSDRLFAPELGGGATLDLGVYVISIAQHFLGDPDSVAVSGQRFQNGMDAGASLLLGYENGRAASLSYALTTATPGRAVIWGTGGSIELGPRFHHPTQVTVRRNGGDTEVIEAPANGTGYAHEIDHVAQCLRDGLTQSPLVTLDDTLAVQSVMEQALVALGVTVVEDRSVL